MAQQNEDVMVCSGFGALWDKQAQECVDCAKAFPDDYAKCRELTKEKKMADEEVACKCEKTEPTIVEPKKAKAPKPKKEEAKAVELKLTRTQVLVQLLREGYEGTALDFVGAIASRLPDLSEMTLKVVVPTWLYLLQDVGAVVCKDGKFSLKA